MTAPLKEQTQPGGAGSLDTLTGSAGETKDTRLPADPEQAPVPADVSTPAARVDEVPLAAALRYAARGWRVHPLRASGNDKNRRLPRLKDWQNLATVDRGQIELWWAETPATGVGIATGSDGFFVLDIDNKNGKCGDVALASLVAEHGELPPTLSASTPSGGRHLYFCGEESVRNSVSVIGEGLDIRGVGGYVVAPSSAEAGRGYRWMNCEPIAVAPAWLVEAAVAANSKTTLRDSNMLIAAGSRNTTLFKEGAKLRRFGAGPVEIADHLRTLPVEGALDPGEVEAIAASAARYEPVPWAGAEDPCTDLANAYRLHRAFGHLMRFVEGIGWHVWGQGHGPWRHAELKIRRAAQSLGNLVAKEAAAMAKWVADAPDDDVREARRKSRDKRLAWIKKCESAQGVENALKMAQPLLSCKANELDANPMLLGTPSGVLELDTGVYREHRQTDLLTRVVGCDYDAAATAPTFRRFLDEVMCGDPDLQDYIQRLIGYSLSGHRGEHLLPIFYGGGANGKSTLLGVIQAVFDEYSGTAAPGLLIAKTGNEHPTGLADLQGRRLVVSSETGETGRLNEEQVKALTGGDRISARRMRMDFYQFDPTHQLIMQTNHKPRVSGTDEGIWRRLRLIPFNATIPPERRDPRLLDKLRAELPGIFAWAVEGWQKYQAEGFRTPAIVVAATAEYRNSSDQIGAFIAEGCDVGNWLTASAGDLYRAYRAWCDEAGEQPRNQVQFGVQLAEKGFESGKTTGGVRRWKGLAVRAPVARVA